MSNNETERYNGWANRETWAVALHINNDQGWQESVHEQLREATLESVLYPESSGVPLTVAAHAEDVKALAQAQAGDIIRENVESVLIPDMDGWSDRDYFQWVHRTMPASNDIGSLHRVDWTELGRSFLADIAEDETEGCSCGMADRGTPGHDGSEGEDMPSSS